MAMGYEITLHDADAEQLDFVARHLRPVDVFEAQALGLNPGERLSGMGARSSAKVWHVDGEPTCAFGCTPATMLGNQGTPWMVGTSRLDLPELRVPIARLSRPHHQEMIEPYDLLINWIYAGNDKTIRWLKWLGYKFEPPRKMRPFDVPFRRFWRQNHV